MERADLVIIGGGVIGTSIAYRLAGEMRVMLIEAGEIGSQTSGACDKAIFLQSKRPGVHLALALASRQIYDTLEEELGFPIEYQRSGGMVVIENEAQLAFMKAHVAAQNEAEGVEVELLDRQTAREYQPILAPHILGSTYSADDGEVNPILLTQAFAKAAVRRGLIIKKQTRVTNIVVESGRVVGVETDRGRIATDRVINATGPFAAKIGAMVGIDLPIKPRRGVILISERTPPRLKGNILCAQYLAAKHLSSDLPAPPYGIGLSLGQTKSGNLLIGSSREYADYQKSASPNVVKAIAAHAARIVPGLKSELIIRTMVGFRPVTPDGLPIIDEVPHIEGLIMAAGHCGDGIALAAITGKLVRSLLYQDGEYREKLAHLRLDRFMP